MEKTKRQVRRHLLALACFAAATPGLIIPVYPGVVFFLVGVVLLAIDYRWVRDNGLRRLYRWFPVKYKKMSLLRRQTRIRWTPSLRLKHAPRPRSVVPPSRSVKPGSPGV